MRLTASSMRLTVRRVSVAIALCIAALATQSLPAGDIAPQRQSSTVRQLTAEQSRILARAKEILQKAGVGEAEREVRLQVLKAVFTGIATRPEDEFPEVRNPKYWTLSNEVFVVAPGCSPLEAIDDMWVIHENDGVPLTRIRCYKYTSLILIKGYVEYFRQTGNRAGLAALERLLGHRLIPQGLPNAGDDLLWKRRLGSDGMLPGDQAWFDNPCYYRGKELLYQENYEQAIREGKSHEQAAAAANAAAAMLIVGEEGSNVIYLGDDKFIRGAGSVTRLARDSFQADAASPNAHELVATPMIFTRARFQEHMIDDDYTAQACLRADPASVRREDFRIERVRSPISPENLLRRYGEAAENKPLQTLIDALASHNKPPQLAPAGDGVAPLFAKDYDWQEQQRVRRAIEAVLRTKSDEMWWLLRANIHDNRYVLTATRGGAAKNFSLGAICSDIVDARLCLAFTSHLPSVSGRLPASFRPEEEFWQHERQWSNEHAPLYAMQAALCQRALQQWKAVQRTLPGSDGQSHIYTADEKAYVAAALDKEITERNATKKARYEEVVVPLLPAPGGWEGFDAQRADEAREEYATKAVGAN